MMSRFYPLTVLLCLVHITSSSAPQCQTIGIHEKNRIIDVEKSRKTKGVVVSRLQPVSVKGKSAEVRFTRCVEACCQNELCNVASITKESTEKASRNCDLVQCEPIDKCSWMNLDGMISTRVIRRPSDSTTLKPPHKHKTTKHKHRKTTTAVTHRKTKHPDSTTKTPVKRSSTTPEKRTTLAPVKKSKRTTTMSRKMTTVAPVKKSTVVHSRQPRTRTTSTPSTTVSRMKVKPKESTTIPSSPTRAHSKTSSTTKHHPSKTASLTQITRSSLSTHSPGGTRFPQEVSASGKKSSTTKHVTVKPTTAPASSTTLKTEEPSSKILITTQLPVTALNIPSTIKRPTSPTSPAQNTAHIKLSSPIYIIKNTAISPVSGRDQNETVLIHRWFKPDSRDAEVTHTVSSKGALIAALVFGTFFTVSVIALVTKRCYEGWQRRYYHKVDYLVEGLYA